MSSTSFTIHLEQLQGYEFKVKFDGTALADLHLDEPAPLGQGKGPNAARLLAAAVGNCLSASLLFCLDKSHHPASGITATATAHTVRNEHGRVRIGSIDVRIALPTDAQTGRCLSLFEDYCVVTQSVRAGVPVTVTVVDAQGNTVHQDG
jgi:organic hydroperoxide reductase OsmC/OhrA